jgi:GNAT superfamily N-acetyltransferase
MSWRTEKGEKWENIKGIGARDRFKKLVFSGKAHGVLAYAEGGPVGWCSFDRRKDYAKLDRAPSLKCSDAQNVWSIPCFFVKSGFRGQGVAGKLLEHAEKAMKKLNVEIIEGYPVKPSDAYKNAIPAAFAWTGTQPLFLKAGFEIVGNKGGGKQRVRKLL